MGSARLAAIDPLPVEIFHMRLAHLADDLVNGRYSTTRRTGRH